MQSDCINEGLNIYFEERKKAAESNTILSSREGASELLDMSVSNLSSIELGKHKAVPPDVVVRMAELYNAPRLINHYCLHECPFGSLKTNTLSSAIEPIERIAVKFFSELRAKEIEEYLNYIIDIAQDGEITEDELENCEKIERYFDRFCKTYSEFKTRIEMVRNAIAA